VRQYFGTDGVRGVVGEELTPALVERLGRAFALWSPGSSVLVGRDTRASGVQLEAALANGLLQGGSTALLGGVLPTAAVALLEDDAGAVVSASHNPAEYNGVKFFAARTKLTDDEEEAVEALIDEPGPGGGSVGRVDGVAERYAEVICERFGHDLGGLRIIVDCANGALSDIAPAVIARLGADVMAIANEPDGTNINRGCGATDLSLVSRTIAERGGDLGLAFDGDGDRLLAVDSSGEEVDGDQILAVLALHLGVDLVAVTSMTNLGFHRLMAERGIRVITTDVGDRYVLEALRRERGTLGGEQSGHLIVLDGHVTGDGLAAGLLLCRALAESGASLRDAVAVMPRWPQAKRNVRVRTKALPDELMRRIDELNDGLAGRGRLLVRPSGTEPVVRVLAEAEREQDAQELCATMAVLVERELGKPS
jgi:phosphoglucosamine mutase